MVFRKAARYGLSLVLLGGAGGSSALAGGGSEALTPGWDGFPPLTAGDVTWSTVPGGSTLDLTYTLIGAEANHEYTVGMHHFDVAGFVDLGLGFLTGPPVATVVTRESNTSKLSATELGFLQTNGSGNGSAVFDDLLPNPGVYGLQLNLRAGGAPGCPTTNCNAVYRTGTIFAGDLVRFTIPASTSFWSGDESDATDEMGANDATEIGSVAYREGVFRNGFDLDGSSWLALATPVAGGLASTTGFTIDAWIVQDSFSSTASILNVRTPANASGFTLEPLFATPGTISFAVNTSGVAEDFATITAGGFATGRLHHVVATFDATTHTMRLYRDDALVAERTDVPGSGMAVLGTETGAIGHNLVSNASFDGLIDELLYFPRALAPAELQALDRALLSDGFEGGNTTAWDTAVP